jgi:hypothetical protein
MRPWVDPHERGVAWGGVGFPIGVVRLLSQYLQEFFEPVMSFLLDITTAFILGFFFLIQSISVFISLDSMVMSLIKYVQKLLHKVVMRFMGLLFLDDNDKRTIGYALIDFASNLLFAELICRHSVSKIVWDVYFVMPCLSFFTTYTLLSMLSTRVELNLDNRMYRHLLFAVLIGQTAMFFAMFSQLMLRFRSGNANMPTTFTPREQFYAMLFVLKANIDMFFQAASSLYKVIGRTFTDHYSNTNRNQAGAAHPSEHLLIHWLDRQDSLEIPAYLEIARQSIWLYLTVHQWLHLTSVRRQEAWLFYAVFFHISLSYGRQFRDIAQRARVKRLMTTRFHRITAEELSRLQQEQEQCAICLNEHTLQDSMRIPCQHIFHAPCLSRALQATPRGQSSRCPICRADIQGASTTHSSSSTRFQPNSNQPNSTSAAPSITRTGHMTFPRGLFTGHFQAASDRLRTNFTSPTTAANLTSSGSNNNPISESTSNVDIAGSNTALPFLRFRIGRRRSPMLLAPSSFVDIPITSIASVASSTNTLSNSTPSTSTAEDEERIARTLAESMDHSSRYSSVAAATASSPSTSLLARRDIMNILEGLDAQINNEEDEDNIRQNHMDVEAEDEDDTTSSSDGLDVDEGDNDHIRNQTERVRVNNGQGNKQEEEKESEATAELDALLRFLAQEVTEGTGDEGQPEHKSRIIDTALMVVDAEDNDDGSSHVPVVANVSAQSSASAVGEGAEIVQGEEEQTSSINRRRKRDHVIESTISSSQQTTPNTKFVESDENEQEDRDAKRPRL